jgi:hypothetical protein
MLAFEPAVGVGGDAESSEQLSDFQLLKGIDAVAEGAPPSEFSINVNEYPLG